MSGSARDFTSLTVSTVAEPVVNGPEPSSVEVEGVPVLPVACQDPAELVVDPVAVFDVPLGTVLEPLEDVEPGVDQRGEVALVGLASQIAAAVDAVLQEEAGN